jgi:hypothetical protein
MVKQTVLLILAVALVAGGLARRTVASDLVFGCWNRPTCGKVCKLVCEKKKLTVVGYGSKCETICVPGPSCRGSKHCAVECCGEGAGCACGPSCGSCSHACQPNQAKIEFCWRDWFARGCAKPRTVTKLTKYQAEKEICWFHWEVVDAVSCGAEVTAADTKKHAAKFPTVYKAAPADALVGDVLPLSDEDRASLAAYFDIEADENVMAENAGSRSPRADRDFAQTKQAPPRITLKQQLEGLLGR